jgi:benzoate membrane transport protein
MLAGVIFKFCISPFTAAVDWPAVIVPGIVIWLILFRFATIWAAPAAMATIFALAALQITGQSEFALSAPTLEFVAPSFDLVACVSLAIPLYLVTMASQNVPGVAIMKSFGYEVPFRPVMLATGLSTVLGSFFGGFAMNLAAITAALNANEHAHRDQSKRWLASVFGGALYILLAFGTSALVNFVTKTPSEVILAVAGLALVPTIANSLSTTVENQELRIPAVLTFLVGASGIELMGVGPAFWALVAGLLVWAVLSKRTKAREA